MTRSVDQVQAVRLPVLGVITESDRMSLDCDSPFPLQIHRVEKLRLHIPFRDQPCRLKKPVGQGGLPVVHVGDDAKVSDQAWVHNGWIENQPETFAAVATERNFATAWARSGWAKRWEPETRMFAPDPMQLGAVSSLTPPSTVMSI